MKRFIAGLAVGVLLTSVGVAYAQRIGGALTCREFMAFSEHEQGLFAAGVLAAAAALSNEGFIPRPVAPSPSPSVDPMALIHGECRNRPSAYVEYIILRMLGYQVSDR